MKMAVKDRCETPFGAKLVKRQKLKEDLVVKRALYSARAYYDELF